MIFRYPERTKKVLRKNSKLGIPRNFKCIKFNCVTDWDSLEVVIFRPGTKLSHLTPGFLPGWNSKNSSNKADFGFKFKQTKKEESLIP